MKTVEISPEEFRTLQDYKHESPHKLAKGKTEAILLLSRNVDLEVVTELAERTTTTIKTRLRDWHQDPTRIDTHRPRRQPQRIQTHPPQQRTEITTVLQQPLGAQGLPTEFWTVPDLADWLDSHFHVVYASETSYHFLPPSGRAVLPHTRGRRPTPSPRNRDHSPHEPDPPRTRNLLERPRRDDHDRRRGSDRTRSDPTQGLAPHRRHHETTRQPDQTGTVPSSGSSTNTTAPST